MLQEMQELEEDLKELYSQQRTDKQKELEAAQDAVTRCVHPCVTRLNLITFYHFSCVCIFYVVLGLRITITGKKVL